LLGTFSGAFEHDASFGDQAQTCFVPRCASEGTDGTQAVEGESISLGVAGELTDVSAEAAGGDGSEGSAPAEKVLRLEEWRPGDLHGIGCCRWRHERRLRILGWRRRHVVEGRCRSWLGLCSLEGVDHPVEVFTSLEEFSKELTLSTY